MSSFFDTDEYPKALAMIGKAPPSPYKLGTSPAKPESQTKPIFTRS